MSVQLSKEVLLNTAKQFGTPLYAYHAEHIIQQLNNLQTAFAKSNVKIFYASKALTNINILKLMHQAGACVDCSSINEALLAKHAGLPKEKILYTSNGIAFDEIAAAKELGIHINIDSLSNLEKFGIAYGHTYPVGVRLRPNIMAGGNIKISTGHDKSKFGIPVNQLEELLAIVKKYNIHIQNLHIHTGSDIKDVAVWMDGFKVLFELIPLFPELKAIDLGGGFKVPYKTGDGETDITLLGEKIYEAFADLKTSNGEPFEIWFEPGKYLVSAAGYFITQVNVLKETASVNFAQINSGFNHLIRPMFYDAYHQIENINNPTGEYKQYAVVGNICETDNFAWDRPIAKISEGDYLVFYNAGAYGFEMSSNFNSRFKPAEVLIKAGKAYLIRRRDEFEDLLRNQVIVL